LTLCSSHIREPPAYKWLASRPMLGNWPVKHSLLLNILRSKRCVEKKRKKRLRVGIGVHAGPRRSFSIYARLKYVKACVSAVVCLGSGHRTLYNKHLYALDVLFGKLWRSIVTLPSDTDQCLEWREILTLQISIAKCKFTWTSLGAKNSCLESICPIPIVGKEATHLGSTLLSIQRFGAMAGGSEMPLSLDCILSKFLHLLPDLEQIVQNQCA